MPLTIQSAGEHALIERLRRRAGPPPAWVPLGIGDDAAVIQPARGAFDVVTADSLVENVHFRREWMSAGAIGHKALAVNLSDLAAMGATPRATLLSLAMPVEFPLADFDALVDAFVSLGDREKVALVGGNLTRSPGPLVVDVTLLGAARPRRLLTRSGGRPGHELYLTGSIGAAAAGLACLEADGPANREADAMACIARYERPEARVRCGVQVARNRAASACMDLSDGLADAAGQLASASRTGVILDAEALPIHPSACRWAAKAGVDPITFGLAGGEDYELLFSVGPRQRRAFLAAVARCHGLTVSRVGRLTAEAGQWLVRAGESQPLGKGFTHF
jgi:thiamine-monophosphate kinase